MGRIAIVGAGPAGVSAGWHLASRGHDVDLIDRATFPRPKTCGDWIPLLAVGELEQMGLTRTDIEHRAVERAPIAASVIVAPNGTTSRCDSRAGAYCIPRFIFDAMLWRHAVSAGCRPIHRAVRDVVALLRDYDHVIDARGAHAGVANAVALRAYWTVDRRRLLPGEESSVQIHTDGKFRRGYGWMFPVHADSRSVRINVGVGLWAADSVPGHSIADYYAQFSRDNAVLTRWRDNATIDRAVGCHVGLGVGHNTVGTPGILRVGDAANLADPLTGDGIGNALTSGRLAAEAIIAAGEASDDDGRTGAAGRWQARYDAEFAPEITRARLLQRALTSTLSKNLTAGVLTRAAGLRARVHASMFGERRYRALTSFSSR